MDKYSCYWLGITPAMTLYSVVIYHYFSKVGSVSSGILHKLLKVSHKSHYFSKVHGNCWKLFSKARLLVMEIVNVVVFLR